jgi:hypothetical protein
MIVWDRFADVDWSTTDEHAKGYKNDQEHNDTTAVSAAAFVQSTSSISWMNAKVCPPRFKHIM